MIVKSQGPSYIFLIPLRTGVLYKLKMVTSFFVKSVEQLESHSCPIERRLALLRSGYGWACVAVDGNIGIVWSPEIVG